MPPKGPPKIYQVYVRSHKINIHLTLSPEAEIQEVKDEIQSALSSSTTDDDIPQSASFEICKAAPSKDGTYDVLDNDTLMKEAGLSSWDNLYLRFHDPDTGALQPVDYTPLPSYLDEDPQPESSSSKRKAKD
ncbi:hypothetical protein CYLTODRAFT_485052 [Cylindrobasidium torrendii FP15055 ss-10]|uniref:Ubiquitin-like domain-containing protein n=1 Tax=Cylindrobasidium torrendii FP15055 ss-10 TaxID=1314674 RepID=A0A0D7BUI8_9AGAR|nr:hypothetical protein CYLTODRAFT_485052 [Cylindrobasidium torrendii FP15055 ss-10]